MTLREKLNRYEPVSMHGLGLPIEEWLSSHGSTIMGKIDFTSGLLVANIGHDRWEIAQALERANGWTAWYSPTEHRLRAYKALASVLPGRKFVLLNSGSEAIDCAIKVCRDAGFYSVALQDHYWGSTIGARDLAIRNVADVGKKSVAWFLQAFHGPTCRWMNNVVVDHYSGWQKNGDILVFDENQAGVGRTGRWWGYQWFGVDPDIVVGGKAIAGGVPCAFVAGRPDLMDANSYADYPSTFSANAFACEALVETIRIMKAEKLVARAHTIGNVIRLWAEGCGFKAQGRGAAWAIGFKTQDLVDRIFRRCLDDGLIVMNTYQGTVKIAPPLVISDDQLGDGLAILKKAIEEETK